MIISFPTSDDVWPDLWIMKKQYENTCYCYYHYSYYYFFYFYYYYYFYY